MRSSAPKLGCCGSFRGQRWGHFSHAVRGDPSRPQGAATACPRGADQGRDGRAIAVFRVCGRQGQISRRPRVGAVFPSRHVQAMCHLASPFAQVSRACNACFSDCDYGAKRRKSGDTFNGILNKTSRKAEGGKRQKQSTPAAQWATEARDFNRLEDVLRNRPRWRCLLLPPDQPRMRQQLSPASPHLCHQIVLFALRRRGPGWCR